VRTGAIATVDAVVTTVAARKKLADRTGALAVDMESAAVAAVAERHGLRFAAVRAITDVATRELVVDWARCLGREGNVRWRALAAETLASPGKMAEVLRLWYASRIAARNLQRFLLELARSPD